MTARPRAFSGGSNYNSRGSKAREVPVGETRTGEEELRADVLERLVAALERFNDARESQRPPPREDAPPVVVEPQREPYASRH